MKKGQITVGIAIVGLCGTVGAGLITGWFTSNAKTATMSGQIDVIEERENNHYLEIKSDIKDMKSEMKDEFSELKSLIKNEK